MNPAIVFWTLVITYLVLMGAAFFSGLAQGERGVSSSKDLSIMTTLVSIAAFGVALMILILDVNLLERTLALKLTLWCAAMFAAAMVAEWARKGGYSVYKAEHPYLT